MLLSNIQNIINIKKNIFIFLFILCLIYLIADKFLWINTDNFYWLWAANNPDKWLNWMHIQGYTIYQFVYPHFYGFLLIPIFYLFPSSIYSPKFIALITSIFIILIIFSLYKLIKINNYKISNWELVYLSLVFFSGYWILNFIIGGDISPKFLGLFLYFIILYLLFKKNRNKLNNFKIIFFILVLYLIHAPDLLYLFTSLCLYIFLFNLDFRKKYVFLTPFIMIGLILLLRFLIQSLNLYNFRPANIQYQYIIYNPIYCLKYFGFLPYLLSIYSSIKLIIFRNKTNELNKYMVSFFILGILFLLFPDSWARATFAAWSPYRNLIYHAIPVSFLSIYGLKDVLLKIKNYKIFLYSILIYQLFFLLQGFGKIFISKSLYISEQIINISPTNLYNKLSIINKDQSFFRNNLDFARQLNSTLDKKSNGLILTKSWDLAFIFGTYLDNNNKRKLWFSEYGKKTAFIFADRSLIANNNDSLDEDFYRKIKEENINWLLVDSYWYKKINNPKMKIIKSQGYWLYDEIINNYIRDKIRLIKI